MLAQRNRDDCAEDPANGGEKHPTRRRRFPPAAVQRGGDPPVGRSDEGRVGSAARGPGSLHVDAGFPDFSSSVWEGLLCLSGPAVGGAVCAISVRSVTSA